MNGTRDVPLWARAGLDALAHGYGHAVAGDESDRRLALLGFDVAIEGTITGFLRDGPGADDDSTLAGKARRHRAGFWSKASWLVDHTQRLGLDFHYSADEMNEVRSARNDVQHGGDWWVPADDVIDVGRSISIGVVHCLIGTDLSRIYPSLYRIARYMRTPTELELAPPADARVVAGGAWRLARRIDPEAEGIHYKHLTNRMLETGFQLTGFDPARSVYDALNRAHDRFARVPGAPGVWRWKEAESRNPRVGVSGAELADVCYDLAKEIDPDRRGLSYSRDLLAALIERGVRIRGVDLGATVNAAIRRDRRFARVEGQRGVYRWQ